MNLDIFYTFTAGMLILAATPGPGVIGAVSRALSGGFKASLLFIAGLVIGDIIFFLLALGGMSAISEGMGKMFFLIKIAGGVYLFYLGIKMFRRGSYKIYGSGVLNKNRLNNFTGGLLLTLGNPKPILFYASILPAIIDLNSINTVDAAAMIAAIAIVSFLVLGIYSFIAALSGKFLTKQSYQDGTNRAAGLIMCATGTYIALK